MSNKYKSLAGQRITENQGIEITVERENEILGTGSHSTVSNYEGMIADLQQLQGNIDSIGINGGLSGMVYKVTDTLKITSPQQRYQAKQRTLETEASRLDRIIKSHGSSIEKLADDIKGTKSLKRDAKAIVNKYKAIEDNLINEESRFQEDRARMRDELGTITESDPKYQVIQENVDNLEIEIDKINDDLSLTKYQKHRAAKALIKFNRKLKSTEHYKLVLRNTMDALEDAYNKLDLKIDEVRAISANNGSSVIKTLEALRNAHVTYDRVAGALGDTPEQINRTLTSISTDLVPESYETTKLDDMNKELARSTDRRENELMRIAENIMKQDMSN